MAAASQEMDNPADSYLFGGLEGGGGSSSTGSFMMPRSLGELPGGSIASALTSPAWEPSTRGSPLSSRKMTSFLGVAHWDRKLMAGRYHQEGEPAFWDL